MFNPFTRKRSIVDQQGQSIHEDAVGEKEQSLRGVRLGDNEIAGIHTRSTFLAFQAQGPLLTRVALDMFVGDRLAEGN